MRLIPITNAITKPFRFVCVACGKANTTDRDPEARADLDGEPFKAYYCGPCAVTHRMNNPGAL